MDSNFAYPPSAAPVRPRINAVPKADPSYRTSNALRASVLDAALLLGIGNNNMVTDWMFNNSLEEVEEPEQPVTTRVHDEPSTRAAPHPYASPQNYFNLAQNPVTSSIYHILQPGNQNPNTTPSTEKELNDFKDLLHSAGLTDPIAGDSEAGHSSKGANSFAFPDFGVPPRPATPKKLKKKRYDGYESDAGYVSESNKKSAKEAAKTRAKEEKALLKEERKKKKSLVSLTKSSKKDKDKEKDSGYTTGYDTDANALAKSGKKNKKKQSADGFGYETDAGYISAATPTTPPRSKSRFFRLGSKASKPDLQDTASVATGSSSFSMEDRKEPPVPLPIAGRFATTLVVASPSTSNSGLSPVAQSRAPSPIPPVPPVPLPLPPTTTQPPPVPPGINTSLTSTAPSAYAPPASGQRESFTSAESASSAGSNIKWRAFPFINNGSNSNSNSNTGSNRESFSSSQNGVLPQAPATSSSIQRKRSSSISPNVPGTGAFPAISLPITRSTSNGESVGVPPPSPHPGKKRIGEDVLSPNSQQQPYPWAGGALRAPSPSPPSVSSPLSPNPQVQPAPTPLLSSRPSRANLRQISTTPLVNRPVIMKRRTSGGSGSASGHSSGHGHDVTLPPPNVLAFYDIPPPSPPPVGPLPSPPPVPASAPAGATFGAKISRQVSDERMVAGGPYMLQPPVQRGREPPFPTRPLSPAVQVTSPPIANGLAAVPAGMRVPRYRGDLYAPMSAGPGGSRAPSPQPPLPPIVTMMPAPPARRFSRSAPSPSPSPNLYGQLGMPSGMVSASPSPVPPSPSGATRAESGYENDGFGYGDGFEDDDDDVDDDVEGEEELRGVLDRFAEGKGVGRVDRLDREMEMGQAALGRRRSFEELQRMMVGGAANTNTSLLHPPPGREDERPVSGGSSINELDLVGYYSSAALEDHRVPQQPQQYQQGRKSMDDDDQSHYPEDEMAGRRTVYYEHELEDLPPVPPVPPIPMHYRNENQNTNHTRTTGTGPRNKDNGQAGGKYGGRSSQWSRWSESVYSRASIMEEETSGEARERFLKRINDMYDENGRERDMAGGVSPPSSNSGHGHGYRSRQSEERDREWEKIQATLFANAGTGRVGKMQMQQGSSSSGTPPVPKIPESAKTWRF